MGNVFLRGEVPDEARHDTSESRERVEPEQPGSGFKLGWIWCRGQRNIGISRISHGRTHWEADFKSGFPSGIAAKQESATVGCDDPP